MAPLPPPPPPVNATSTDPNTPAVSGASLRLGVKEGEPFYLAGDGVGVLGSSGTAVGVRGESETSNGVYGIGHGAQAGVSGYNDGAAGAAAPGVYGESANWQGVYGISHSSGAGVMGVNDSPSPQNGQGIWAESKNGDALYAISHAANHAGVEGVNDAAGDGVRGTTGDSNMSGVLGVNSGGGNGVYGKSVSGNGVAGFSVSGNAGWFLGNHFVDGNATVTGNAQVNGDHTVAGTITGGTVGRGKPAGYFEGDIQVTGDLILINSPASGDVSEDFDLEDDAVNVEPGSVMIIGTNGKLRACDEPYDSRLAGVVSGAGELRPAVVLQRIETHARRSPIALIGKVFCKVDARFGAIMAGDLLTTSPTRGHAMKVTDRSRALGSIVGKALGPHHTGCGLIQMLVNVY